MSPTASPPPEHSPAFVVVIPARHASTRLPGKMLADLNGKPMILRVAEQALRSKARRVIVATDHPAIAQATTQAGIETLLTREDHASGTDRIAEAVELLKLPEDAIVVNVQGDEPLIDPLLIDRVATQLCADATVAMATCATPVKDAETLFNPNAVKVVCDRRGHALYFSRAPVPWDRDALKTGERLMVAGMPALHHIGLYAYRVSFLKIFPTLEMGVLEKIEALEQLRALEFGYGISVLKIDSHPGAGIDTAEDLERVRRFLLSNPTNNQ